MTSQDLIEIGRELATATKEHVADVVGKAVVDFRQRIDLFQEQLNEFSKRVASIRDGVDGKDGSPGRDGVDGTNGKDGVNGVDGLDGATGADGAVGPQGPAGALGEPGQKGDTGEQGPAGASGADGVAGAQGPAGRDGKDGEKGDAGEPGVRGEQGPPGPQGEKGLDGLNGRDGQPGAPGATGTKGVDGLDGKDGKDGLGFDDIQVEFDGERSFTLKFMRGDQVKTFGAFRIPAQIYRGVHNEKRSYEAGDTVTWGGAMFHALKDTTDKPGVDTKASRESWVMCVRRGAEGKMGPQGPAATVPVVRAKP